MTRRFRCVRLEVEPELEMVGELLLRRGLVLVQEDGVVVAALQPTLVVMTMMMMMLVMMMTFIPRKMQMCGPPSGE